jgi:hypothetical protein
MTLGPSGRTMNSNAAGHLQNIKQMWLVCNQPRRCVPYRAKTKPNTRASSKAEASGAYIVQRSGSNYITDNAEIEEVAGTGACYGQQAARRHLRVWLRG